MDESTSMVIDVEEFAEGKKELLIVLLGVEDEYCNFVNKDERKERCEGRKATTNGRLRKNVTITLEPIATTEEDWKATSIVAVGYLVIAFVCVMVSGVFFEYNLQDREDTSIRNPTIEDEERGRSKENCSMESEIQFRESLESRIQPQTPSDKSRTLYKKNQLYMVILFIISIFYAVNVLQTAFHAKVVQYQTGNNDICYYNSRCQNPLLYTRYFLDFNHFFSNLGYVVFGLTYIGIVYMKSRKYNEAADNQNELLSNHGIPYLTGVYYSMGGALVMEGLMSAAYHICPTTISFQYDTTFMYLIAILIYVKLYQNRHPDSSASSVNTYIVLGFAIVLEAISIHFSDRSEFWVIFCIIYVLGIIYAIANIYQLDSQRELEKMGRFDQITFFKVYHHLFNESLSTIRGERKGKKTRPLLIFLVVMCVINILLCIYFGVKSSRSDVTASNFLLLLFMINMGIYFFYYLFMKFKNNERPTKKTWAYLGEIFHF